MPIQTCSKCGKTIEGFAVTDGEDAYHPGCAPKEFRTEAKAQRKEARGKHVGVRTRNKIVSITKRHAKAVEKAANLYAEVKRLEGVAFDIRAEMLALGKKGLSDADQCAVSLESSWNGEFLGTPFVTSDTSDSIVKPEAETTE